MPHDCEPVDAVAPGQPNWHVHDTDWLRHASCGEGELIGGVHTLVWRSVQVYHELQELEEEDKGREEVQEIERESPVEETHSDDHGHVDEVKDSNILSRSACADDVTLCNRRDYARYAHVDVSGSCQWCTHRAVPRNHGCCNWRPRCALSPTHRQFWISTFLNFPLLSKFSSGHQAVSIHHHFSL